MAIQKPEWFKMDAAKFLCDAQVDVMSTLELGACLRLLCRQWIDGFIPDDQRLLARLCRLDATAMAEAWVSLSPFFPVVESGKRANRFMWIEREKVIADLARKSDEGTRAAHKRWAAKRSERASLDATPSAGANRLPMPDPMQDQTRADQTRLENTLPQPAFADVPADLWNKTKNSKPSEKQIDQLYDLYPRKRGKLDARKAIRKAAGTVMAGDADHRSMQLEDALNYLGQRVTLYARCVQGRDQNFIPYPASWFNAGAFWDDEQDWVEPKREHPNTNNRAAHKVSVITGSAVENTQALLEAGGQ